MKSLKNYKVIVMTEWAKLTFRGSFCSIEDAISHYHGQGRVIEAKEMTSRKRVGK